jgi:hypothetical protein
MNVGGPPCLAVGRFAVDSEFLKRCTVQNVWGATDKQL